MFFVVFFLIYFRFFLNSLNIVKSVFITILVKVRHFGMSELCSNVWIPQQPLQDEHGQAQGVIVALKWDQLPIDCLRTDTSCSARAAFIQENQQCCFVTESSIARRKHFRTRQDTSRPIRNHSGLYERSQLRTFRRSPRRQWKRKKKKNQLLLDLLRGGRD